MFISLLDYDSSIPNLALMKIAAYHKSIGDHVELNSPIYDKLYISNIFEPRILQKPKLNNIYIGGAAYNNNLDLPKHIENMKPYYDLYNDNVCQICLKIASHCKCRYTKRIHGDMNYSLGYTTRGCIRKCDFCIVPTKEGPIRKAQHIKDFHDPKHKIIVLLDNNWYALKDWFFENSQYCIDNNLQVTAKQGLDIRILTDEIAEQLSKINIWGTLTFAFDSLKYEKDVIKGIEILKQHDINLRHKTQFFVLVGFDSTFEEDLYRCNLLKDLGTSPFVMRYNKNKDPDLIKLSRWANRRMLFWKIPFEKYDRSKGS